MGVALVQSDQQNAFCLTGGEMSFTRESYLSPKVKPALRPCSDTKSRMPLPDTALSAYSNRMPCRSRCRASKARLPIWTMAPAGYDPREAIAFWKRMMETKNGQQPPELMSTHPADATRINQLENLMPGALEEYQIAMAGANR
jgi:hypothetical protein